MPVDYTADGKNISPPIAWSNLPAGTKELALICEDPIAPTPQPFVHWVVYKIPATAKGLPENMPADAADADAGRSQRHDSGAVRLPPPDVAWSRAAEARRRAPVSLHRLCAGCPARGSPTASNKTQLLEAMKGHIIGQGEIMATYERKPPQ